MDEVEKAFRSTVQSTYQYLTGATDILKRIEQTPTPENLLSITKLLHALGTFVMENTEE